MSTRPSRRPADPSAPRLPSAVHMPAAATPGGRGLFPLRVLRSAALAAVVAASGGLSPLPPLVAAAAVQSGDAAAGGSAPSEIENSKYQSEGVMTRPEFVRALPGERFYATMRLDKGARVVVVGAKTDWLKILPPAGSFSYVNKTFVQKTGPGGQGRVTAQNLLVKAGSSLQPVMWITQAKLNTNDVVEILEEDDQYFKIRPPEGAYLYVPTAAGAAPPPAHAGAGATPPAASAAGATTVTPPTAVTPPAGGPSAGGSSAVAANPAAEVASPREVAPPRPEAGGVTTVTPTTVTPSTFAPPADAAAGDAASPPATGPAAGGESATGGQPVPAAEPEAPAAPPRPPLSAAEALAQLQALEGKFAEVSQQPLADQPLADLSAAYDQVGAATGLSDTAKRIVEIRLATLKVRADAREQLRAVTSKQAADQAILEARRVERQELEDQFRKVEIQRFAAVGTLRPSSLQVARTTLYRLTDPQTGRTLVYVWGTDPKVGTLVDRFVGVRGAVQTDPRLQFKVINPAGIEPVDSAKANTAYVADLVPPSIAPKAPTATTNTPEH
jgi:hypothetical protein